MNKRLYAFRGAICTLDTEEEIIENVKKIFTSIVKENGISEDDIVSVQFTTTPDITELNPATALRKAQVAPPHAALFCSQEPVFKGSLPQVIRIMIFAYVATESNSQPSTEPSVQTRASSDSQKFIPKSIYMNGAESLRPDLSETNGD